MIKSIMTVARLEIRIAMRNRWVMATTMLMTVLALSISTLGSSPSGTIDAEPLMVSIVSLASLTIFLVPLMALLISFDTVVGEIEQGTMLLMLSYPISRTAVVLGKFVGASGIISFATILGYGFAGLVVGLNSPETPSLDSWMALVQLIVSSSILGAAFVSLGLACSCITDQRGTAAGIAVSIWLLFVIIFDLALLGALVAGLDAVISKEIFPLLLAINPADAFRMINMDSVSGSGMLSGMAEVSSNASLGNLTLWSSLFVWSLLPLMGAIYSFKRKDV